MSEQLVLGASLTPKHLLTYAGLQITAQLAQVKETTGRKASSPSDIFVLCEDLSTLAQEAFIVITINSKNAIINRHLVTLGIADSCLVHPREVFRPAILDGASAIICAHNHPSGSPDPSGEDIKVTNKLVEAGRIIDIKLMDHVIIGRKSDDRDSYLSLRESGLVSF